MNSKKNNVSFDFRSYYEENHDTDMSVSINGEHVDDEKLERLLNTFLKAIGSDLSVTQ